MLLRRKDIYNMMTRMQLLNRLNVMNKNYSKRNVIQKRTITRYTIRGIAYLYPSKPLNECFNMHNVFSQIDLAKELKELRYTTKGE